jgi:hypothetical protein
MVGVFIQETHAVSTRGAILLQEDCNKVTARSNHKHEPVIMVLAFLFVFVTLLTSGDAIAMPPQLYHSAAYQSPVRGEPDDLLLLPGYGFAADDAVVYRAISTTANALLAPSFMPDRSTAESGIAAVVSAADIPFSLTIQLPPFLRADQSYALWVRNRQGEWSQPVMINDARPLWFTPAYMYATASLASLPRELKVVGRNMQPSPGHLTQIRLIGPQSFTADALTSDAPSSETLNQYVARAPLPKSLRPGSYRIEVSRDGASWLGVPDQRLEVLPDPAQRAEFSVSDVQFGGCRPDDGADDTACLVRAIAAAKNAGGGSVYLGPGTWDLIDSRQPGLIGDEGIAVPEGVALRGAGSRLTRLARHAEWTDRAPSAAGLTLLGNTLVTGFTFMDLKVYQAQDRAGPFLQLGEHFDRVAAESSPSPRTPTVDAVIITGNVFDKTMVAIGNGGLPISRLVIAYNTIGAFHSALQLGGNGYNMVEKFRIDDSVIAHNVFKPGSELNLVEKTGTLVSELGAGHRVDFSENTADGASKDYLYSTKDATGWRAAFFWNMNNNVEEMLVSQNVATCTGDKIGDGEAISFDNNFNTFGFKSAVSVVRANVASVAVSESLATRQNNRDVPIASYYVDHWVQIVDGPGLGEARKIVSYSTDSATNTTTFTVAPNWDVIPVPGRSRIAVGREFWQVYTLGNQVDNRRPLCQKSNRSRLNAGAISVWAQSADSVIAGNRQYDSDGIFVQQNYIVPEHPCTDCTMAALFQSSLEIRANLVDGEYDWDNDCSTSGIALGIAAAAWGDGKPPAVGFGVSISRNTVRHADGQYGGAIAQLGTWYAGPEPHRWPLSQNVIIQHNSILDIDGPRALPICGKSHARMGIAFPDDEIAWNTLLYANSCKNVSTPVGPGGVNTAKICSASAPHSCECP